MIIRELRASDIDTIVSKFGEANWLKPRAMFETYLREQKDGQRLVWVAYIDDQFVGYVTLNWHSKYQSFYEQNIPEIMDLNVLHPFRNRGIGAKLLETAELRAATKSNIVGIGVGLYEGYGAAQNLYIKRGYLPDGRSITYNYHPVVFGETIPLDDDLVLWFAKELKGQL